MAELFKLKDSDKKIVQIIDKNGVPQYFKTFDSEADAQNYIDQKTAEMGNMETYAEDVAVTNALEAGDFAITVADSIEKVYTGSASTTLDITAVTNFANDVATDIIQHASGNPIVKAENFYGVTGPTYSAVEKGVREGKITEDNLDVYIAGYTSINVFCGNIMGNLITLGVAQISTGAWFTGLPTVLLAQSVCEILGGLLCNLFDDFLTTNTTSNDTVEEDFKKYTLENIVTELTPEFFAGAWDTIKDNFDIFQKLIGYEKLFLTEEVNGETVIYEFEVETPNIFDGLGVIRQNFTQMMTNTFDVNAEVDSETTFKGINYIIGSVDSINEFINTSSVQDFKILLDESEFNQYVSDLTKDSKYHLEYENSNNINTPVLYFDKKDSRPNKTGSRLKLEVNINQVNTNDSSLASYVNTIKSELSTLDNMANEFNILTTPEGGTTTSGAVDYNYTVHDISLDKIMELSGMKDIAISKGIISNGESLFAEMGYDSTYLQSQLIKFSGRIANDGSFVILYGNEMISNSETLNDILFPLIGNNEANKLFGTHKTDTLKGNGGDDIIFGWGQDANEQTGDVNTWSETNGDSDAGDNIYGGDGADHIYGGKGNDNLYGAYGTSIADDEIDTFYFEEGDGYDTIHGAENKDRIVIKGVELGENIIYLEEESTSTIRYYKDSNDYQYTYETALNRLTIIYDDDALKNTVVIENFYNGNAGITLEETVLSYCYGGWEGGPRICNC